MNFEKHYLFEECVARIFSEAEFDVSKQYKTDNNRELMLLRAIRNIMMFSTNGGRDGRNSISLL